jgi:hypothetical protein
MSLTIRLDIIHGAQRCCLAKTAAGFRCKIHGNEVVEFDVILCLPIFMTLKIRHKGSQAINEGQEEHAVKVRVVAAVCEKDGKVLMVERTKRSRGFWEFPGNACHVMLARLCCVSWRILHLMYASTPSFLARNVSIMKCEVRGQIRQIRQNTWANRRSSIFLHCNKLYKVY